MGMKTGRTSFPFVKQHLGEGTRCPSPELGAYVSGEVESAGRAGERVWTTEIILLLPGFLKEVPEASCGPCPTLGSSYVSICYDAIRPDTPLIPTARL